MLFIRKILHVYAGNVLELTGATAKSTKIPTGKNNNKCVEY